MGDFSCKNRPLFVLSKKTMKTFALILIFSVAQFAQTKPPIITTESATTKDGRIVVLSSDGTWKYSSNLMTSKFSIDVETAFIFRSGEVVPVPSTEFYLLNKSVSDMITSAWMREVLVEDIRSVPNLSTENKETLVKEVKGLSLAGLVRYSFGSTVLSTKFSELSRRLVQDAVVARLRTDLKGKGVFSSVPPGRYYIFGVGEMRKSFVSWNLEIDVADKDISVTLDTTNDTRTQE